MRIASQNVCTTMNYVYYTTSNLLCIFSLSTICCRRQPLVGVSALYKCSLSLTQIPDRNPPILLIRPRAIHSCVVIHVYKEQRSPDPTAAADEK